MNEELLIQTVRIVAIILIILIIALIALSIWRNRQRAMRDSDHPRYRRSAIDRDAPLEPDSKDAFVNGNVDISQNTAQLNPSFFGSNDEAEPSVRHHSKDKHSDAPTAMLPYTIMARFGRHLSGKDVANLVHTFGLQRAPSGAYELIGEDGEEVVFTMLNVRKPGVFPTDLNSLDKLEGLMLIMQLPVGDDAVKSWETFTAIVHEMTEAVDARLCDYARRPIGDVDLIKYRQAAEQFEQDYQTWRQQRA